MAQEVPQHGLEYRCTPSKAAQKSALVVTTANFNVPNEENVRKVA